MSATMVSSRSGERSSSMPAAFSLLRHLVGVVAVLEGRLDLLVLKLFEFQQHPAQVPLDRRLFDGQLGGSIGDERSSVLGRVEVERIDMELLGHPAQHVHP